MDSFLLAFLTAFGVLTLELALYHVLAYVGSPLQAVLGVTVALGGMALGASLRARRPGHLQRAVEWLILGALLVPFFLLAGWIFLAAVPAFTAAGYVLADLFETSVKLYAADLLGAGLAAAAFPWLWPLVGHENVWWAVAGLQLLVLGRRRKLCVLGGLLVLGLVVANHDRTLNFAHALKGLPGKVFEHDDLLLSRCDLTQRVDVTHTRQGYELWLDGWRADVIRSNRGVATDRRLAAGLGISNPRILLVGTAGQGVLKPARLLSQDVEGLELNRAIVDLLEGPLAQFSRDPYRGVKLRWQDGRAYLAHTGEKYDLITLLNTHRAGNIGQALAPEYLLTGEGLQTALNALTPRGFLSIEERLPDRAAQRATDRLLATLRTLVDPQHIGVYEWYSSEVDQVRSDRDQYFLQILVSRAPIDAAYLEAFAALARERPSLRGQRYRRLPHVNLLYVPGRNLANRWAREVLHPGAEPLTDDRPFPGSWSLDVFKPLLPLALVLAWALWPARREPTAAVALLAGLGYTLLQTLLFQRLQLMLGTPAVTLVVTLGGMLALGGLGARLLPGRALLGLPLAWLASAPLFFMPLALPGGWPVALLLIAPVSLCLGAVLPSLPGPRPWLFAASSAGGALGVALCLLASLTLGMRATWLLAALFSSGAVLVAGRRRPVGNSRPYVRA